MLPERRPRALTSPIKRMTVFGITRWTVRQRGRVDSCRLGKVESGHVQGNRNEHRGARAPLQSRRWPHSNLAGTENGLVASKTNIISAVNSVALLLKTSIAVPARCPFIDCPASTFITPWGVRCRDPTPRP